MQVFDIVQNHALAQQCVSRGNLAAAEVICRNILGAAPDDATALHLLGRIAAQIGMRDFAVRYLSRALAISPENQAAQDDLIALTGGTLMAAQTPPRSASSMFLVIKSWGFGFWSDVSQVLGALLLAEVTGRTPVVHWGLNSLFGDRSVSNAFHNYFHPISNVTLNDISHLDGASYFPPKWNHSNLLHENVNKWRGSYSRAAALYFLARPEPIAVCDFYIGVIDVVPWLHSSHPMYERPLPEVYRYLIRKYLQPLQSIVDTCEAFYQTYLSDSPLVALHIRGSDKGVEDADLERNNHVNFLALETIDKRSKIFLLSDDETWVTRVRGVYRDRVITTDSLRTSGKTGLHHLNLDDRVRLGREVMADVYIALRANKFYGNGRSNVAAFISLLKEWKQGDCVLSAPPLLMERNLFIHIAAA